MSVVFGFFATPVATHCRFETWGGNRIAYASSQKGHTTSNLTGASGVLGLGRVYGRWLSCRVVLRKTLQKPGKPRTSKKP